MDRYVGLVECKICHSRFSPLLHECPECKIRTETIPVHIDMLNEVEKKILLREENYNYE